MIDRDVAVVIGVGGMGMAIARRVGVGRRLLLAELDETTLKDASQRLSDDGHDVATRQIDVSDEDSVRSLAKAAADLGRVTIVAHTAGLSPIQAPTSAILRVDLLGVALVLDAFASVVAPGGAGIVISSTAGHMGLHIEPSHAQAMATTPAHQLLELPFLDPDVVGDPATAYMLAKRANILRVQSAAATWGARGARINSISPGVISTPMGRQELEGAMGELMRAMVASSGTGRLGTPDDIADAASFLLGPQASFITGADLVVDGGMTATIHVPSQTASV